MAHLDWLPTREQDLLDLMERWLLWLLDAIRQVAFGWDAVDCTTVTGKITAFVTARTSYEADLSPGNRVTKDNAKNTAVESMRNFANSDIRHNKKMQDADKLFLGIHVADTTPTASPVPTSWPVSHYDLNTVRQVGVTSEDSASGRKALPHGVRWVEHTWVVFKPGEAIPEPLPNIVTFDQFETWTKPSETCKLQFTEALRRGAIAHTSRWVNTRSEPGPWAPIQVVTIP
jgi:hypothetical protein